MFGVEMHSFLPDDQGDGCDLACQSQTRHLRTDSLSHQRIIKLLKRPRLGSGHGGGTLVEILEIMIVISVQPTNGRWLLRTPELPLDVTILGAAVRLNPKPAISPQLSLGTETMWCLNQSNQQSRPDRPDERNLPQQFPHIVLLGLGEQLPPYLLAQSP